MTSTVLYKTVNSQWYFDFDKNLMSSGPSLKCNVRLVELAVCSYVIVIDMCSVSKNLCGFRILPNINNLLL